LEILHRQTSISGDFGRIFCIGYATNDEEIKVIKGTEVEILKAWWLLAQNADIFIGHNIMDFDLRFIFKRSIVNNIKPAVKHLNLSFARYRNFPIFDTMREWEKWNRLSFIKLDTLAKILGLQSSKDGGIDGSQLYDYYLAGKFEEIYNYCARDVKLTREIYKKMVFDAN
jgi:predicted PolB exonuclease-like 3'-5' exonuclease